MRDTNRQWLLAERPSGMVGPEHFLLAEGPVPRPDLDAGEILVRVTMVSFEPAMRGWMDDVKSYLPPVPVGTPMRSPAVGEILASSDPEFPVGAQVTGTFGWQDYAIANGASGMPAHVLPEQVPPSLALGVLGGGGLTAYVGMIRIGELKEGDTVLVSGAAGSVGSIAAQIARIKGCRVIGIAGGDEKCRWLRDEARISDVIDYRCENVEERLGKLCPDGIDLFFDNVGGTTLEAGIAHIADFGRIVLCGMIAGYNDAAPQPGPRNLMNLVIRRVTMRGYIVMDHMDMANEAMTAMGRWVMDGQIAHREDIRTGFANIPATFQRLFDGSNRGKQLLEIED